MQFTQYNYYLDYSLPLYNQNIIESCWDSCLSVESSNAKL